MKELALAPQGQGLLPLGGYGSPSTQWKNLTQGTQEQIKKKWV